MGPGWTFAHRVLFGPSLFGVPRVFLIVFFAVATYYAGVANMSAHRDTDPYVGSGLPPGRVVLGVVGAAYMVMLYVAFRLSRVDRWLVYATGVAFWAYAPAGMALSAANGYASPHDWLVTGWHWSLKPLPVDVTGPAGLSPRIEATGWMWAGLVGLEVYTVALVVTGAGLLVKEVRERRSRESPPAVVGTPSS